MKVLLRSQHLQNIADVKRLTLTDLTLTAITSIPLYCILIFILCIVHQRYVL